MKNSKITKKVLRELRDDLATLFQKNLSREDLRLKGIEDPVTAMDLAISEAFFEQVGRHGFRRDQVLSEEQKQIFSPKHESFWIIDPIDGTKEFVQRIPEYSVSVGFVEGGRAVGGFLYNPENQFFVSLAHDGVEADIPSDLDAYSDSIVVSRSEIKKGLFQNRKFSFAIQPMGSIAYKLGLVAAKKARAVVSLQPKHSWDICAGVALVTASGGIVTNLEGKEIQFHRPLELYEGGLVACSHPQDLEKILAAATT